MNDWDDDLTNGQASASAPADGEQSEDEATVKAAEASGTGTGEHDGAEGQQADGAGEEEEQDKPKKRRSGVERLKRERDALRDEVELLRSRTPVVDDGAAIDSLVRREIGDPPSEDAFRGDWFAYERAMTAYEAERRIVTREVKALASQVASHSAERMSDLVEDFNDRVADAVKVIPDFLDVVGKTNDRTHPVSPIVGQLILESEKGALLQYHFARNPADLRRLNGLSPLGAAREIGKIEARLSLAKPTTATRAPPPVTAPKGGASPSSQEARMEAYLKRQYGDRA
ncbi:hypothetical protein SAMN05216304_109124 [Bosea sp. OK403]|uniref:hypothetical protein n=1 Tax=Bosea sp. OK403 TaxID=1855286 RepID=UPI0008E94515|nr:hypothetical protein [Bosea sp. OK403]SFJ54426.1 hypothetical protein SAMN05216304_109124 [Bosea sp. OK403]